MYIIISRNEFKDIYRDLFDKSIPLIEKVLKYSNLTKDDIDEIIWSTRIPKIEEIIKQFFYLRYLNCSVYPKEVYVEGAALQDAIVDNVDEEGLEKLILLDVTPLSLGIDGGDGITEIIFPRNTTIPFIKNFNLKLINDLSFICKIYEGEGN